MKINWFTVIAQIINFLLLVWLMRRFLYKPVLKAIDEREKKIAAQLEDAEAKKTEAKKEQYEFKQKNEEFDKQKGDMMNKAVAEIKAEREKLLEDARDDAALLQTKLKKAIKDAGENINRNISQKIQQEVFAITRKTLTDLASTTLEEQSVHTFLERLDDLKEDEKKTFIHAFTSDTQPVLIQSAFNLPPKQQTKIKHSLKEILGEKVHFEFKTAPELTSGIELNVNGYKLGWSISEYISSFEKHISEIMTDNTLEQKETAGHENLKEKKETSNAQ